MKKSLSLYLLLLILISFISCKSSKNIDSQKPEEIFSLNTTACMGTCPVFDLSLYGDKRLVFNGKENTKVDGKEEIILEDEQFEALLGIIKTADWVSLKEEYRSDMQDLPTQNFTYNFNGVTKKVTRYGAGPESISNMSDIILAFVEEQVFRK